MLTQKEVHNTKWRNELNRILLKPNAQDQERLFFVCFCYNTLNWNELTITECIKEFNKWNDFNIKTTVRNVNIICEKIQEGKLGTIQASYSSSKCSETTTEETHREQKCCFNEPESETAPSERVFLNRSKTINFFASEFQVSHKSVRTNEKEVKDMPKFTKIQELEQLGKFDDGSRWYKVSLKKGTYGEFFSVDTGPIMPCQTAQGEVMGYAPADRYLSLPSDRDALNNLITALNKALDMYPDGNKKKKNKE